MSAPPPAENPTPFLLRQNPVLTATLMLALCCLCWGFAFPSTQFAMNIAEARLPQAAGGPSVRTEFAVTATLNGWRFLLAALLYGLLTLRRKGAFRPQELAGGAVLGVLISGGIFAQMLGLHFVRPSVSAFLTSVTVIFTPLAQAFLLRRPLGVKMWLAVGLAVAGVAIFAQPNPGAAAVRECLLTPPVPYLGEILTVFGAALFSSEILALDYYGPRGDPMRLTLVMFATVALVSLLAGALTGGTALYARDVLAALSANMTFLWAMGGTILFSGVVAMHLMNVYQPLVSPARASVIYCLEPVFATMFSVLFSVEALTATTLVGSAVILAAVLTVSVERRGAN
jgi:drug/metabolite transporter (DMT)-like permease